MNMMLNWCLNRRCLLGPLSEWRPLAIPGPSQRLPVPRAYHCVQRGLRTGQVWPGTYMQFQHQWTSATERESQRCCTCKTITSSKCRLWRINPLLTVLKIGIFFVMFKLIYLQNSILIYYNWICESNSVTFFFTNIMTFLIAVLMNRLYKWMVDNFNFMI